MRGPKAGGKRSQRMSTLRRLHSSASAALPATLGGRSHTSVCSLPLGLGRLASALLCVASNRHLFALAQLNKREFDVRMRFLTSTPCLCSNTRAAKMFSEMLAGIPQQGKTAFWRLRESRNKEKPLFGACGNPATMEKCFLVLAGVPQAFPKTF